MQILVVEDDEPTANALATVLAHQNYTVEQATDGEAAWELVESYPFDLVLLDVMIPKVDGISLCKRLRSQGYQMPVLLLTARDSGHDKAIGLDAGADDYVVKPFNAEELTARIRALLRRGSIATQPVLEWGELTLDPSSCEVVYRDKPLTLTPKEYALLELFLRNNRRVFSCGVILEQIWSFGEMPGEEAVRTHIKGLRQKLKAVGAPTDLIETVYGIGYRLKPIEHLTKSDTTGATSEEVRQQTMTAIAGVWERFKPRIIEQVAILERAALAALNQSLDPTLRQQAGQEAHTLAGSLGTFGFPKSSRIARKLEQWLKADHPLTPHNAEQISTLVQAMRQDLGQNSGEETASTSGDASDRPLSDRPLLLIVDRDRSTAEQWIPSLTVQSIRATIAANLYEAREIVYREHPQAVLLDLTTVQPDGWNFLAELNQQVPPIPALVIAAQERSSEDPPEAVLQERLQVVRSGGRIFLEKPVSPEDVVQAVTQALQHPNSTHSKLLVVDDDPQILATLRTLLEPWGLGVATLDDPRQFWETLEETTPDLLILDINMPYLNGVELCQVVRNDARWSGLPIMILTAQTDADTVNQVFAAGADDFVSKPIVGPELVSRLIHRLERIRLLRRLAETDPLTGLANRQQSTQALEKFLSLAAHHNQPLCLAILDLDHLKSINDRYGHAIGDSVLRQVGQVLQRSFWGEDVIARWGGEFLVGMYGTTTDQGIKKLQKVSETLAQQGFKAPDSTRAHITFSAGVAQYPQDGRDLPTLYKSANIALRQAQATGQNRILSTQAPLP